MRWPYVIVWITERTRRKTKINIDLPMSVTRPRWQKKSQLQGFGRLCLENGLSVVKNPKLRSKSKYKHYGEWQKKRKRSLNFQEQRCLAIDSAFAKRLTIEKFSRPDEAGWVGSKESRSSMERKES